MAELHIIGQLVGAKDFPSASLFCRCVAAKDALPVYRAPFPALCVSQSVFYFYSILLFVENDVFEYFFRGEMEWGRQKHARSRAGME